MKMCQYCIETNIQFLVVVYKHLYPSRMALRMTHCLFRLSTQLQTSRFVRFTKSVKIALLREISKSEIHFSFKYNHNISGHIRKLQRHWLIME